MLFFVLITMLLLSACGHPKAAHVDVPPPPAPEVEPAPAEPAASIPKTRERASKSTAAAELAEPTVPANAKPLDSEIGLASWYGPPYHNRRASNGEVYNMHAMTAAHRTYPLGSVVRVTNVKTGSHALVRITDRGPFIRGRVIDLSLAAAEKIDVKKAGVAKVKVELMQSPAVSGAHERWVVQIGGFPHEAVASKMADQLTRRYRTAKVLRFASPAGDWWIRVRVPDDDHGRAQKLAAETKTSEGAVFLVRLD
jgi:rare lipoprotein A